MFFSLKSVCSDAMWAVTDVYICKALALPAMLCAIRLFFVFKQEILRRNLIPRRRFGSKSNLIFIPMTSVLLCTKEFHLK